jgi:LAGLIDADG DNA endonuclease family
LRRFSAALEWLISVEPLRGKGNTEGRKFVVETLFAKHARAIPLTSYQKQLVIGSLLGDGTLLPTTAGCCFRVHHGIKQSENVDWKFRVLEQFVRSAPRVSGTGYYFRTITHPEFLKLRELFYSADRKIVPLGLIEDQLNDFGLAVWIMDDGAADGKQLRLNTQSFSSEENEMLAEFLRAKFGLEVGLNIDKGRSRLRFKAATMDRLLATVSRHLIPSMLYKLSL